MSEYVKIYFKDIRPMLQRASKKQTAALFLAALDYAQYGKIPQTEPGDWMHDRFAALKRRIDEGSGGNG